jgi:TPR repeat protein
MMNKNTVQLFSTSMFRSLCSVLCALTLLIALPNLAISQTRPADKPDSAIDQLKDLAEKGSAEAQTKLADLYREGEKVAQDLQKSAEYYKKAADQGFAEAQYKLGKLYMEAKGLAQKPDEAFDWMKKAADQGFTAAKQKIDELAVKTRESMEGVIKPIKPPEPPADKKGQ